MASVTQSQGTAPHLLSSIGNNVTVADSSVESTQVSKARDVTATFNYFKDTPDGQPPAPNYVNSPTSYVREYDQRQKIVHDIRGTEDQYSLDTTGFEIYRHESVEKDFVDDEQIKRVYYPEVEEILKKATGASKVFIFDHTVRRNPNDIRQQPGQVPRPVDPNAPITLRGPVRSVHIDQSYKAGLSRVPHHLPEEAETLLKGRVQIINVWRPIKTILKDPLGVIAANTVNEDELVPIKLIYPNREGETFSVRPEREGRTDGGHKWHYLFQQTPTEVTLIKCFDSKTDGRARRVPHSSFIDEEYVGEDSRESIEVRTLVFHPDDTE